MSLIVFILTIHKIHQRKNLNGAFSSALASNRQNVDNISLGKYEECKSSASVSTATSVTSIGAAAQPVKGNEVFSLEVGDMIGTTSSTETTMTVAGGE